MTPNGCLDSSVGTAIPQTVVYDQSTMEEMNVVDGGVDMNFVFRMAQQGSMSNTATVNLSHASNIQFAAAKVACCTM